MDRRTVVSVCSPPSTLPYSLAYAWLALVNWPHSRPSCLALLRLHLQFQALIQHVAMFGRPGPSSGPSPRRPRSPRPSHSSSPAPSASLLSLLATVAASIPAVDGSPAPLLFLYPRYAPADEDPQQDDIPFAPALLSPLAGGSSGSSQPITRRRVPSKYEKDDNGKWRKAETYSLYGSTMCPVSFVQAYVSTICF